MNKLNLNCPINRTGYGITSLNIMKNLSDDIEISLFPIGSSVEANSEDDRPCITKNLKNSHSFDHLAPCLKIWHQFDLASRIGSGKYFSFPFFEVDKLKPMEKYHLNSCDGIFVASHWAQQVLVENDITKPIYVSPLGVDTSIFNCPPRIKIASDNYIFFHIGKWEHRKAQDFLFKCFDSAFNMEDNVELWLLPDNPFLSQEETKYWIDLANNAKLRSKIKIYSKLPTQQHVAEFIFQASCGVFLSRAEGWNNEIIESMAMNKPVIVTDYSAHTEYCTKDNCYLVDIDELEVAKDGKWFHGEGNWAKLDQNQIDQAVDHMRFVYNNNITTNPGGLVTAQKYSWKNTANIIRNNIFIHQNTKKNKHAHTRKKTKRR